MRDKNGPPDNSSVSGRTDHQEDVEDIPNSDMISDPFMHARVIKHGHLGQIELIQRGSVSEQRLYRVRYFQSGDCEHLTFLQVNRYHIDNLLSKTREEAIAWLRDGCVR